MFSVQFKMICVQTLLATFCLFASSKTTSAQSSPDTRALERLKWMRQNEGNLWNVNPDEGAFLRDLAVKVHAKAGLEIGTSNGYSSIWIGMGLRQEGGHLLTLEIDEGRAKLAQANFHAAGLDSVITLKLGNALKEVPKLTGPYDFVFIDAWKQDYVKYLEMVIPIVSPGGGHRGPQRHRPQGGAHRFCKSRSDQPAAKNYHRESGARRIFGEL